MDLLQVLCTIEGTNGAVDIPPTIIKIVSSVVTAIQIGVPILLIIWGMLDLGKAVVAQKEDEIKKGQQIFVKRLIAAAIVFFVVIIVKFIVQLVAGNESTGIISCLEQIF